MYGFEAMIQFISESVEEKIVQTGVILGADFSGEESAKEIADKTIVAYQKFCQEQFQLQNSRFHILRRSWTIWRMNWFKIRLYICVQKKFHLKRLRRFFKWHLGKR